jgi:hypothetical protein
MEQTDAHYKRILANIQAANSDSALNQAVAPLLQETGFGSTGMKDPETGEETCLNYLEIAECLMETDRIYFQKQIELLVMANQRNKEMSMGVPPRIQPPEQPPWQQFM